MKQFILAFALLLAFVISNAQEGNNVCAWNAMETYNGGGGPKDLEAGIKCTDEAINNENTKVKSKTWFYRGELYTLVFLDTVLRKSYGDAAFKAIEAFKQLTIINDPKFKDWDDVYKYVYPLGNLCFNTGVEQYQSKNYAQAFQYFYSVKDINLILDYKKKTTMISIGTAMRNAALSAENTGDTASAMKAYKEWMALAPDTLSYYRYGIALKKGGDTLGAKKIIDEGLAKYPNDANLLVEKINFFLNDTLYVQALTYINSLLVVEPKNQGGWFIKGLAYDKMTGKQDSAIYCYKKSIEINPKSSQATNSYINLAAEYVNNARPILEDMNKLGNTAEDTKKYNDWKQKCKDLYQQAKPYLENAKELAPNDAQVNRTLKKIDSFLGE